MNLTLTPIRFKQRAETYYGNKVGIVDGDIRMTYREFGERVARLAAGLRAAGLAPGERVAVLAPNIPALLEAHFGVPAAAW